MVFGILFSVYINCPEVLLSSCQTLKQVTMWDKCNVIHNNLNSTSVSFSLPVVRNITSWKRSMKLEKKLPMK